VVIHSQIGRDIYEICIWARVSYTWVKVLGQLLTPILCCMGGFAMEVGGRDSWHNLASWKGSGGECNDWIGPSQKSPWLSGEN